MPRKKKTEIQSVPDKKGMFPHSQFPIRLEYYELNSDDKHILFFQNEEQMQKYKDQRLKKAHKIKVMKKEE